VKRVVPLEKARDPAIFGSKAVGLGQAIRDGLPVPPGVALSGAIVEAVAAGEQSAIDEVNRWARPLGGPLAVRSSAADEDSAGASFAGQHLTLLNVPSVEELSTALSEIWWSANSDSAITYRQRVGLFTRPSIGVVVQALLAPDTAGVMFTKNPVTGLDERVIEASWGLGEAVVAGIVIPDQYRVDRSGQVLERRAGVKRVAVRSVATGGTVEESVSPELVERLCLDDDQLQELNRLAGRCEQVYGPARDVEWALAGGTFYLLQCRPITQGGSDRPVGQPGSTAMQGAPTSVLRRVPLFAGLTNGELREIARLFKERRFEAGVTVIQEGSGGAAFFVIESGEAKVLIGGKENTTLGPGDYFGEIALFDEGARMATIVATSDMLCYGLTYWDFRPLVEANGVIGWKLLQRMATLLRATREG
jgi:pyruvate,water dikinase